MEAPFFGDCHCFEGMKHRKLFEITPKTDRLKRFYFIFLRSSLSCGPFKQFIELVWKGGGTLILHKGGSPRQLPLLIHPKFITDER